MHRQSLGSPSSKLHSHGAVKQEIAIADEPPRRRDSCVIASTAAELDDDDDKAPKTHRSSSMLHPPPKPEILIHIIPVLTFLCFLVLYLCSHTPSQADLDQFSGFKSLSNYKVESMDIENTMENKVGSSIVAIGSLRNLQEIGATNRNRKSMWKLETKYQLNRKFADF